MIFIWGKRSYGSVDRVGNAAIKTVFGHFWYLPLFPVASYYVNLKNNAVFELNRVHKLSALFGYLRPWLMVIFVFLLVNYHASVNQVTPGMLAMALMLLVFIASYLLDKKMRDPQVGKLRNLMERHFGVALDPHACMVSLQIEINEKMQETSTGQLDDSWHTQVLKDPFADKHSVELAMLRARCDQHDKPLQKLVFDNLQRLA